METFLTVLLVLLPALAFVAGAVVGHRHGWVNWRSVQAVWELEKALRSGYQHPGEALKIEDLNPVMQLVTFDDKHIVMHKTMIDENTEFRSATPAFDASLSYSDSKAHNCGHRPEPDPDDACCACTCRDCGACCRHNRCEIEPEPVKCAVACVHDLVEALNKGNYNVQPSALRDGCITVVLEHCQCDCHKDLSDVCLDPCCRDCEKCGAVQVTKSCYCDVWDAMEKERDRGRND